MCSDQNMFSISVIICTKVITENYVLPLIFYVVPISLHFYLCHDLIPATKQHAATCSLPPLQWELNQNKVKLLDSKT